MHVFEVTIQKDRRADQCDFIWPTWWGEVYQDVDVVAYEDNPTSLGKRSEGAICVCDDEAWAKIAAKNDKTITELDEATANAKGRQWRPQVTQITDRDAVLLITAKAARGEALTGAEKKALDPNDDAPGIGKSKLFDVRAIAHERGDALAADV